MYRGVGHVLKTLGLTNTETEDIGIIASAPSSIVYEYLCDSPKCCTFLKEEVQRYNKKTGEMENHKIFMRRDFIVKKRTSEYAANCPDCGKTMFSRRARNKNDTNNL